MDDAQEILFHPLQMFRISVSPDVHEVNILVCDSGIQQSVGSLDESPSSWFSAQVEVVQSVIPQHTIRGLGILDFVAEERKHTFPCLKETSQIEDGSPGLPFPRG